MPTRTLPSGKQVEFTSVKGRHERQLLKDVQARRTSAFDELMKGCTKAIDGVPVTKMDQILELHTGDRVALLLMIRWETHGPDVEFSWDCKDCNQKSTAVASIEHVDFEAKDLNTNVGPLPLPRSGFDASWLMPTGHTERKLADLRKGAFTVDSTHILRARGVAIAGKALSENELDDLEAADRAFLWEQFKSVGGPDSVIDAQCSNCGVAHRTAFEKLPDLFFPAVARP